MSLNDKEREAAFPVHIELGRKETDMGGSGPVMANPSSGKKGKPRVYYPTVYIDNVPGLEQLPKEGCILVGYRRTRLSLEQNSEGKETAGVTLELKHFCLPEEFPAEAEGDLSSAFDRVAKGKSAESDEADDDGEYEEEEEE